MEGLYENFRSIACILSGFKTCLVNIRKSGMPAGFVKFHHIKNINNTCTCLKVNNSVEKISKSMKRLEMPGKIIMHFIRC